MTFTGIPLAALDFYEDLENDNSKSFWTAHKATYEESVKAPLLALAAAVESEFGAAKVFRPFRDVRFSKDKTPYKTHQGVWFADSHRYIHIGASGLLVGGGYWQTSPAQIARLRRAADDDIAGSALERAFTAVRKAKLTIGGDQVTRVPSGFDKERPRADLLRYKTLTAGREFGAPAWLSTRRAQIEIVKAWRAMSPLVEWLDTHVGTD
ncbi:MAG TPA: DUF2461 domain-containing protein [Jatrophihabitans sp.]|jgi:uncharacterized protein (TIGR02453 family)